MKCCPYCGKQYSDEVMTCALDQHPLVASTANDASPTTAPPPVLSNIACPACGSHDGYQPVVSSRGSFNLLAFLAGGLLALLFFNASQPRRVRCNRCEHVFTIRPASSRVSKVIFWLLIAPTIALLLLILIKMVILFSSRG